MNILSKLYKKTTRIFSNVNLIDKCLIIIMAITMSQSILSMFINESNSTSANSIDIIIRTTSAGIFGYFLSSNFIKNRSGSKQDSDTNSQNDHTATEIMGAPIDINATKGKIGFDTEPQAAASLVKGQTDNTNNQKNTSGDSYLTIQPSNEQIVVATVICVVALLVLVFTRDFTGIGYTANATVTQMRDFVSGCVGFLLGSPGKAKSDQN